MKKTVAVIVLLTTVTVFFCSNVFAFTEEPQMGSVITHNYSHTASGCNEYTVAAPLYPSNEGYTVGGTFINYWTLIVSIRIENNSDKNYYVPYPSYEVFLNRGTNVPAMFSNIMGFERISGELTLQYDNSTKWFYAHADNGLGIDKGFILPAHSTLGCTYAMYFPSSTTSGQSWTYATLDDFRAMYFQNIVEATDLPAGTDLDINSHLNSIDNGVTDILAYLGGQYGFPYVSQLLTTINNSINSGITTLDSDLDNIDSNTANIYNFLIGQYGFSRLATLIDVTNTNTYLIYQQLLSLNDKLSGDSTTNQNITTDSGTIKSQSDNIHNQEQVWFTQNSSAIQATGLSNYRFGTVEGNGIAGVSNDFTAVWNSLGGWTSVYIFSLTLGLALTIIRHVPSAVSRRRKKAEE